MCVRHGQLPHPSHQLVPIRVRRRRTALRAPVLARNPADTPLGDIYHHRHVLDRAAPPPKIEARGAEFPFGDLLQDLDVQLLVRHQTLQPGVLLLQVLQALHRVAIHRPVLGPPLVQRHLGHPQRPRHLGDRRALRHGLVSLLSFATTSSGR